MTPCYHLVRLSASGISCRRLGVRSTTRPACVLPGSPLCRLCRTHHANQHARRTFAGLHSYGAGQGIDPTAGCLATCFAWSSLANHVISRARNSRHPDRIVGGRTHFLYPRTRISFCSGGTRSRLHLSDGTRFAVYRVALHHERAGRYFLRFA